MTTIKPTGPISVTDEITPITKTPISPVDADMWDDMSPSQLLEQKSILYTRLEYASKTNRSAAKQIQTGIQQLEQILASKTNNDVTLL